MNGDSTPMVSGTDSPIAEDSAIGTPQAWELRLGDCLDPKTGLASLADGSVAHIITDPPFSSGLYKRFRTNKGGRKNGRETKNHLALASAKIGICEDVAIPAVQQFIRIASRWMVIFQDAETTLWRGELGRLHVRCGVWIKTNPMPQVSGDRPAQGFEAIEIAHAPGKKYWNGGGRPAVWTFPAIQGTWTERKGNNHPCPKPLALMEALIRDFTDPGDLICDPFAGSGTTGVACIRLGRRFLGWERDDEYYANAIERLSAAREQLGLWDGAA